VPDQIYAPGPDPAPLKYNVPGSQQMIPRACQALYNGSGAAGSYVPALIFRSQAGHVIARAILDSTIAAGDDAEVSWFPGVKHAAAATPAGAKLDMCIAKTTAPYTIAATGGGMTHAVVWTDVRPVGGTYTWPVAGNSTKIGMPAGIYLVLYNLDPVAVWVNTSFVVAQPNWVTSGTGFLHEAFFLTAGTTNLYAGVGSRPVTGKEEINLQITDQVQLLTGSSAAAGTAISIVTMTVIRLGDSIAGTVV
jgi:hypothetical protein